MKLHSSGLWFCVCCALAHASDGCACDSHDREPLSAIPAHLTVAMGLTREAHADGCPNRDEDSERIECDCETIDFSASQCEGCGSYLAGERYAFSLFYRDDKEAEIFEEANKIDFDAWSASFHNTADRATYAILARRALTVSGRFREFGNAVYARTWADRAHRWVERYRTAA